MDTLWQHRSRKCMFRKTGTLSKCIRQGSVERAGAVGKHGQLRPMEGGKAMEGQEVGCLVRWRREHGRDSAAWRGLTNFFWLMSADLETLRITMNELVKEIQMLVTEPKCGSRCGDWHLLERRKERPGWLQENLGVVGLSSLWKNLTVGIQVST